MYTTRLCILLGYLYTTPLTMQSVARMQKPSCELFNKYIVNMYFIDLLLLTHDYIPYNSIVL